MNAEQSNGNTGKYGLSDTTPIATITLSQEELLAILDVLQARSIPGLDAPQFARLNESQKLLVLNTARHALQARSLATVREDGVLLVHRALLTAVGVCAYSQSAAAIYHWNPSADTPTFFSGHIRGEDVVAHTRPDPILHQFSLLKSKTQLVHAMLEACDYRAPVPPDEMELMISPQSFAASRQLAEAGKAEEAAERLQADGAPASAADAFAHTFASMPRVSIFQTVKQQVNEPLQTQQFTLLQNGTWVWMVVPTERATTAPLKATSVTPDTIQAALTDWL
jgi:hypothetical protein